MTRFASGASPALARGERPIGCDPWTQADIVRPEGRIHFAGEHCSLHHAWIQGALESGIRAAQAIHAAR